MGTNPSGTGRERLRRDLFEAAQGIPSEKRREHLEEKAGGDRDLLDSVLRLLEAEATTESGILDCSPCPRTPGARSPTPSLFGTYRVVRRVGEGGMGAVFACRNDGETELFAAKTIRSALSASEFRESFEQERRILTALRHPNICRLVEAGITDGEPYLIMEYVEVLPIDRYCRWSRSA